MKNVVFVHGWGFDGSVWDDVLAHLNNINPYVLDLGFTGNEVNVDLPENAIYVGHSLGSMWSLKHGQNIEAFVSIAGFDSFARYIPKEAIAEMQMNLSRNMQAQMRGFYAACGQSILPDAFDKEKLAEGLRWLMEWDEAQTLEKLEEPVVALAAEDDVIFPFKSSQDIWKDKLVAQPTGGHALPLTQSEWCAEQIQKVIDGTL